jgi:hypothetical protein
MDDWHEALPERAADWHVPDLVKTRRKTDRLVVAREHPGRVPGMQCAVEICENRKRSGAKDGLCWGHYKRLLKCGDVQADIPLRNNGRYGKPKKRVTGCFAPGKGKR